MDHDIRELTDEKDLNRALEVFYTSLVGMAVPSGEPGVLEFVEPGRPLGVFVPGPDGGSELVGTAGSFSSRLTVPGGAQLPMSAVTDVGVLPTHRRRGLARALMGRQLEQAAERGEPVATLRASEATIYEQFGYGVASSTAAVEVDMVRARLRPTVPDSGGLVRFVDPKASWDLLARIHAGADGPGTITRPRLWWRGAEWGADQNKDAQYVVVHGEPGAEDGFVRYHPTSTGHWFRATDRTLMVDDLVAHTPAARLHLIRFLFSVDLVHRISFAKLPVDLALEKLMVDERAVRTVGLGDETWLRLVDVPVALAARTYRGAGSVTIGVSDRQLAANTGTYRISAAGAERTDEDPQLSVDVATLATVYLGGTRWWQQAAAGRVTEHAPGALETAEELFATARAPYAGTMF